MAVRAWDGSIRDAGAGADLATWPLRITSRVGQACAPGWASKRSLARLSIAVSTSEVAQIESSGDASVSKPPGPPAERRCICWRGLATPELAPASRTSDQHARQCMTRSQRDEVDCKVWHCRTVVTVSAYTTHAPILRLLYRRLCLTNDHQRRQTLLWPLHDRRSSLVISHRLDDAASTSLIRPAMPLRYL